MSRLTFITIFLISITACTPPHKDSESIPTDRIYLVAHIKSSDGENASVSVNLYEDRYLGDVLELSDSDRLVAHYNQQAFVLRKNNEFLEIDYETALSGAGHGGDITLVLERDNGDHEFTVTMPPPFNIIQPSDGQRFSEGDDVLVTWSPEIVDSVIDIHGHLGCYSREDDLSTEIDNENENWLDDDDGEYEFSINALISRLRIEVFLEDETLITSRDCEFDITLTRENRTELDEILANNSRITAQQFRKVDNMRVELD